LRAYDQIHGAPDPIPAARRHLRPREIKLRPDLAIEPLSANISDETYNLMPHRIHAPFWPSFAAGETFADRVLTRLEVTGQGFVDNRDQHFVARVLRGEVATGLER